MSSNKASPFLTNLLSNPIWGYETRISKAVGTGQTKATQALLATGLFDPHITDDLGRTLADLAYMCNRNLEMWLWEHFHIGRQVLS
jgi:hypothetical protein